MNYFEFHIGDYTEATAHLSFVEDAALSRLIRKIYATEKPLPADVKVIERLVGARSKDELRAVRTVLEEFFMLSNDGWRNKRCEEELARFNSKKEKAKRSANVRWDAMRSHSEHDANALPSQCAGNALQSPVTSLQSPDSKSEERARDPVAMRTQCERIADVSRGTQDAGDGLTRTPSAEELLTEMNDAWKRDVDGVNVEALQGFIDFVAREINPSSKRKEFSPSARLSLAKRLAGMGNADQQEAVVEQSISADHAVLYALKDRPNKDAASAAQRRKDEQRAMVGLKARADAIGFRGPHRGEDCTDYRIRVEAAERDAKDLVYREGLAKRTAGAKSAAELLAGQQ